jgi:hypothetical protein
MRRRSMWRRDVRASNAITPPLGLASPDNTLVLIGSGIDLPVAYSGSGFLRDRMENRPEMRRATNACISPCFAKSLLSFTIQCR